MSRIGKKDIIIPNGVEVTITNDIVTVKGVKGELTQTLHPNVKVEKNENIINVTVKNPELKFDKSLWGLFGSLISNMIVGVTEGYEKKLEVNGVGFKVALSGNKLVLNVGFSHPVEFELPKGIEAKVEKNLITLNGIDKKLVGQVAADIRKIRKPEPYKGKGIKYEDEVIIRKVGKAAAKAA